MFCSQQRAMYMFLTFHDYKKSLCYLAMFFEYSIVELSPKLKKQFWSFLKRSFIDAYKSLKMQQVQNVVNCSCDLTDLAHY